MTQKFFNEALKDMMIEMSYGESVRRLYDLGMEKEEICKNISANVGRDKIEEYLIKYIRKKEMGENEFEYVEKIGYGGKKSFIKVRKS